MTATIEPAAKPVCTRCRSAPPMVPGMTICRSCLKTQVDRERQERERRRKHWTIEQRRQRRAAPARSLAEWSDT